MKLEEVKSFLDYVKKKGILAENSVSSWNRAINAVSAVLDENEKTSDFILQNAAVIKNRLQNHSKDASGNTIALYIQRSSLALKNCIEWSNDRAEWEKKQASKPKNENPKAKAPKAKEKVDAASEEVLQKQSFNSESSVRRIPIPCNNGGDFVVALPQSYSMNDLARVVWALAVYAEDFDPADVLNRYGKPPVYQAPNPGNASVVLS